MLPNGDTAIISGRSTVPSVDRPDATLLLFSTKSVAFSKNFAMKFSGKIFARSELFYDKSLNVTRLENTLENTGGTEWGTRCYSSRI